MKEAGQIVLFRFPQADLGEGKLRPALLLGKLPGELDDWLICMISTQLRHCVPNFDEIVRPDDPDFVESGLKTESLIRTGRLAVVETGILLGAIGRIAPERLLGIKTSLSRWLTETGGSTNVTTST